MHKHRLALLGAALLAGCTFTACERDDENLSKTDMLTNKDWQLTAASVTPGIPDGSGGTIRDVYASYPACRKDDWMRFETPRTYKEMDGANKCSSTDPAIKTGDWSFSSDQTQLYILRQGRSDTDDYSVETLTSSSMKLKTTERMSGVDYTFTYTFAKK